MRTDDGVTSDSALVNVRLLNGENRMFSDGDKY